MNDPSDFTLSSDFASIGNDDKGTVSLTVSAGVTHSDPGNFDIAGDPVPIGSTNAQPRCEMSVSTAPGVWVPTDVMFFEYQYRMAATGSTVHTGLATVELERTSDTNVRLRFKTQGIGGAGTVTLNTGFTVTANVWTMVSPFELTP